MTCPECGAVIYYVVEGQKMSWDELKVLTYPPTDIQKVMPHSMTCSKRPRYVV